MTDQLTRRRLLTLVGALGAAGVASSCGLADVHKDLNDAQDNLDTFKKLGPARKIMNDATHALDDDFGPLNWETESDASFDEINGTCHYSSEVMRTEVFLGHERGTPEQIAATLTTVLQANGWPELPVPAGGTGGWLTAICEHDGLQFEFRSKGYASIAITGPAASESCNDSAG